jgi:hypothetical protein
MGADFIEPDLVMTKMIFSRYAMSLCGGTLMFKIAEFPREKPMDGKSIIDGCV